MATNMAPRSSTPTVDVRDRALRLTLGAMVAVGLAGVALASLRAEADVWLLPTLSHLSSDQGAGVTFRITMLALGFLGLAFAWQMRRLLDRLEEEGLIDRGWAVVYAVALWAMALGFLGVALFPLGVAPLVELAHGAAAYAIPISVLILMLTSRLAIPGLQEGFGRASLLALAAVLLLYLLAVFSIIAYALMEMIAFALGAGWLVAFVDRLLRIAAPGASGPVEG